MSKKMLKRSLALGALMAFVITGSAMAGTLTSTKYCQLEGNQEDIKVNAMNPVKDYITGDGERLIGGWHTVSENNKITEVNTNFKVTGGNFGYIVGGNWNQNNISVTSTNVVIDGATAKQVYAGTAFSKGVTNANVEPLSDATVGRTTSLTILSGTFGGEVDNTNIPEMLVTGGDFIKVHAEQNQTTYDKINTMVDEANVKISGGTFNATVLGGSAVIRTYCYGDISSVVKSVVNNANITITGGEFYDPIVAGGLVRGHRVESEVKNAVINITKENNDLAFNTGADIYAGGIVDGEGYNEQYTYGDNGTEKDGSVVKKTTINIENVNVQNIYGTDGYVIPNALGESYIRTDTNVGYGNKHDWVFVQSYTDDKNVEHIGQAVDTDLSLSNVTANTIDLPKGTLTLADTNYANNVTLGKDVTSINIASKNLADGYSLQGIGEESSLTVEGAKKLTITGIEAGTYNIIGDFDNVEGVKENIQFEQKDQLLEATGIYDAENRTYKVEVKAKSATDIANKLEASESTGNFVKDIITSDNDEATEFLDTLMESGATNAVINDTLNAVQKMGEAGGNSATAASIVKNVTGVTNDRLSFNCGHSAPHKGGHGVGLFEEGSGADVWVEYVHGKDEVEDMPSTAGASSYEGQYNGLVMGVDFKKVGKFQSGIAFNYGEGDTNSVGSAVRTHSDYDFWGVGYYGNIHNDDSNVIFDISYAQTDSDVTQSGASSTLEANPETTTWSAGVKLEKLYQNENVQIVPYTGLRYMSIDSDDYATKGGGFMYNMERQNIWLLPLGVSIRQEIANDNGWTVSPRVDLSYIWAFGDTNSNMEVKVGNGITPIGYDVMDDGSFLGLVGIEAHKGQWGYGVAYSYQKGDHSESKKWYVDVNYSF